MVRQSSRAADAVWGLCPAETSISRSCQRSSLNVSEVLPRLLERSPRGPSWLIERAPVTRQVDRKSGDEQGAHRNGSAVECPHLLDATISAKQGDEGTPGC